MKTFETGKTYQGRFITNSDSIVQLTVIKRTAKTIVAKVDGEREEKRLRIDIHDDAEFVKPFGNYSMAPRVSAEKEVSILIVTGKQWFLLYV